MPSDSNLSQASEVLSWGGRKLEGRCSPLARAWLEQRHMAHPGSTPASLIREGSWAGPQSWREEGRPGVRDTFHKRLCGQEGKMSGILRGTRSTFKLSFRMHSPMSDHEDICGAWRGREAVSARGQNFRYVLVRIFEK